MKNRHFVLQLLEETTNRIHHMQEGDSSTEVVLFALRGSICEGSEKELADHIALFVQARLKKIEREKS